MINQEIIEIRGMLFQVKRKFPEHRVNLNVEDSVATLKEYYHVDTIFKAKGYLWLCNEVKDTEYEEY